MKLSCLAKASSEEGMISSVGAKKARAMQRNTLRVLKLRSKGTTLSFMPYGRRLSRMNLFRKQNNRSLSGKLPQKATENKTEVLCFLHSTSFHNKIGFDYYFIH